MIGGLVAYFSLEPALESRRPDLSSSTLGVDPPQAPGINAVYSRLWDDPLAIAIEHNQRRHQADSDKFSDVLKSVLSAVNDADAEVVLKRSSNEKSLLKGNFKLSLNTHKPNADFVNDTNSIIQDNLATILRNCQKEGHEKFLCLPVLVPGEPDDRDTEERKRTT